MKNSFGQSVIITLYGESHGPYIGAVIDGLAPGIPVDKDFIRQRLALRRPSGQISTQRVEKDPFKIISGVHQDMTTGTPISIIIPNADKRSQDYQKTSHLLRPGHADYTAYQKYHGYQDIRGGGHFSGRITAALVAAGAICIFALQKKGIEIGTHIKELAGIADADFDNLKEQVKNLQTKSFPVLDDEKKALMEEAILAAKNDLDSVGGILETAVVGLPSGLGEPWFDSLESVLAHGLFSIPAVKGVSFGAGFDFARMRGSEANDPLFMKADEVSFRTNKNAGINGGISNGMPILFKTVIKPTSSIAKRQETVDILKREDAVLEIHGRHDPAIVHRAREVVNAMTALTLVDVLAGRYGTDWLATKEEDEDL